MSTRRKKQANQGASLAYRLPVKLITIVSLFVIAGLALAVIALA
jgi:hypothetical protein